MSAVQNRLDFDPGKGRSRLQLRRERLLVEGERIFLNKGYAGASVNEIVRLAGGSLATLYGEFGSKEGLFAEIMRRRASSIFDCGPAAYAKSKSPRAVLLGLASRLLERRLSEDSLALYRIAVSEGPRFPELRKAMLEVTYPAFIATLGEIIVSLNLTRRKAITEAAECFVSLVHGQLLFRAACGAGAAISNKDRVKQAEHAVDAFLVLYPPGTANKRGT